MVAKIINRDDDWQDYDLEDEAVINNQPPSVSEDGSGQSGIKGGRTFHDEVDGEPSDTGQTSTEDTES